jgi:uncharacterized membrane protein YfcA
MSASQGSSPEVRGGAHVLCTLLGLGNVVAGVASIAKSMPPVLATTLLLAGVLMPVLSWYSHRRRRAAWAFLVSICGVFAVTYLFCAPRLAHAMSINLELALIVPTLYAVAASALISLRGDYLERDIAAAPAGAP